MAGLHANTKLNKTSLNRKIKNADIPAKDKSAYQKSINVLKEIFYLSSKN